MSTYHYDGSPCPESCTCAVREVDRLRTQLEAVTRERDEAQAVLRKCHEVAWPRGGDLNGDPVCDLMLMRGTFQAHITALERERDEAQATVVATGRTLADLKLSLDEARAAVELVREECARDIARVQDEARADAARMREALTQVRDAMRATGQEPDGDDDPRRPVASAVWHALASTPSAEPTPRDMRVAEAVRDACAAGIEVAQRTGERFGCDDSYWNGMSASIDCVRDLDLAAVVAKAVKP